MRATAQQVQTRVDMDLIDKIRSGADSEGDFRRLYDRYAPATFAFFMRRLGDPDLAADLNQDLFLRLSRSIEKFEGRCSWRTWVFLIARTVLAESRSQRWARLSERTVTLDPEVFSAALNLELDADQEAHDILLKERLRLCIRRLSDIARAVIVGHYFEGVTLREMTDRLNLDNPSGSRGILIGAQRKLKRCLTERESS